MITKKEALNSRGKLKKGYYYDFNGTIRRAQKVPRTRNYSHAAAIGSLGGKANAKRFK